MFGRIIVLSERKDVLQLWRKRIIDPDSSHSISPTDPMYQSGNLFRHSLACYAFSHHFRELFPVFSSLFLSIYSVKRSIALMEKKAVSDGCRGSVLQLRRLVSSQHFDPQQVHTLRVTVVMVCPDIISEHS